MAKLWTSTWWQNRRQPFRFLVLSHVPVSALENSHMSWFAANVFSLLPFGAATHPRASQRDGWWMRETLAYARQQHVDKVGVFPLRTHKGHILQHSHREIQKKSMWPFFGCLTSKTSLSVNVAHVFWPCFHIYMYILVQLPEYISQFANNSLGGAPSSLSPTAIALYTRYQFI